MEKRPNFWMGSYGNWIGPFWFSPRSGFLPAWCLYVLPINQYKFLFLFLKCNVPYPNQELDFMEEQIFWANYLCWLCFISTILLSIFKLIINSCKCYQLVWLLSIINWSWSYGKNKEVFINRRHFTHQASFGISWLRCW